MTRVDRCCFELEDGSRHKHPFKLSEDWTVAQMQIVFDCCHFDYQPRRGRCPKYDISEDALIAALKVCDYKQIPTAELLGVDQAVVQYRIKKYKITHPRWWKNKER